MGSGCKYILSSGLNTLPNEKCFILCLRAHACLCGVTVRLLMRCWAICTAHSRRDSKRKSWGGNSWCGSAGGVKLQRSALGTVASKVDPLERKQGGSRGESMRQRCEGDCSPLFHAFTTPSLIIPLISWFKSSNLNLHKSSHHNDDS